MRQRSLSLRLRLSAPAVHRAVSKSMTASGRAPLFESSVALGAALQTVYRWVSQSTFVPYSHPTGGYFVSQQSRQSMMGMER